MTANITFGTWLRERRNEVGLTQAELAERLDFSPAMLRKIESGERRPSGQIASLLATYFRVPSDEREAFIAFARSGRAESVAHDGAPANAQVLPPWRGAYAHQTNLPAVLTPLIGREHEEQASREMLLQPTTRLLTLTGTGGIGKTRLALQVASGLLEYFEDGVFFVDLAAVVDPDFVLATTARSMALKEEGDRSLEMMLLEYVRGRRILLVLDNFEQVLDAASSVVALMQASPWLKVLVTSREALHVRGERRFSVPPLGVPDPEHLPPFHMLAHYPSIELFIQRAQDAAPGFALKEENAADVAAVCIGLEGLPLAIELAASRASRFSPAEMTAALGNRLNLLTGGARDMPNRHRTLRATIEWSYNLLDENERRLFRHLGVFVDGFTPEAVEATYEKRPGSSHSPRDTLASLADKSLIRKETKAADSRFSLLEAVREYAIEQMEQHGEAEEAKRGHAGYYLQLADQADRHFTGPQHQRWGAEQVEWMDRVEADLDNMRAALDWYQMQAGTEIEMAGFENLEKGLRLAGDLRRLWFGRGYLAEGLLRLRALLSIVPAPLPTGAVRLRVAYAVALVVAGRLVSSREDIASARPLLEEALGILTELKQTQLTANALLVLGSLALGQEDHKAARAYQKRCLSVYRGLGNRWGAAAALDDLGNIELKDGNLAPARRLLQESLALYRAVGEQFGAASVLASLGLIAYYVQDYASACALWEESVQLRREVGDRNRLADSLVLLGSAAAHRGDYDRARLVLNEGLLLARQLHTMSKIYRALTSFGVLERVQSNFERAAVLFGAAEALRQSEDIQLSFSHQAQVDSELSALKAQLDKDRWERAWTLGSSMTLDDVISSALRGEYCVRRK